MPSRQELVVRANAVGLDPTTIANDSKLEQKVLWLEKNATTFSGTLGTGVLTASDVFSNTETVTIGTTVYTMVTALSEAKATAVYTSTGAFAANDTVTVEGQTYRFVTTPVNPYDVALGANAAAALDNLKLAINAGAGAGTDYGADTPAHPLVTATTNTNTEQTVEAKDFGTYANTFLVSTTAANAAWGAATMTGGVNPVANQVLIGASAAASLDNLKSAINVTTGEGTTYSTGTAEHPSVTATTNTDTQQTVEAKFYSVTNADIATTETGAQAAWGAATIASGVAKQTARNATTVSGGAGLSGDKNV